jgi:hypothetical protein
MEGKKKRYDFETKVRVPTMEEICKATGQFTEPQTPPPVTMRKFSEIPGAKQAAAKYATKPVIRNEELDIIKHEMEALATAVVEQEALAAAEENVEETLSESSDELSSENDPLASEELKSDTASEAAPVEPINDSQGTEE